MSHSAYAQTPRQPTPRLLYVDNLRLVLITLVIMGHMAITYGAPTGEWYYHEPGETSEVFAILTILLLGIGASFLLGLFYMIAGYFTPAPYDRKGLRTFILERLLRLGTPLLVYALLINPLVTYWAAVHGGYQGSFPAFIAARLPDLTEAAVGPLWFVEALLFFSLLYAAARLLRLPAPARALRPLPSNRQILAYAVALAAATFVVRIWAPFGWWWEPLHQEPAHLPQYLSMFFIGVLAYRQDWFSRFPLAQARTWGWVALALVPGLPVLAVAAGALRGEFDPAIAGGLTWLSLAYSLWEACIGTALVIATLVWFRQRFNQQGRLARLLSPSAYAVYVLHPLVIVPLALALSSLQLALELKFALVTPLAAALSFLAAGLLRRIPGVKSIL